MKTVLLHSQSVTDLYIVLIESSDPYVVLLLKPKTRFGIEAMRTQPCHKNLNPEYYKQFNM